MDVHKNLGCLAGFVSSWIGWKMHSEQLPAESKLPNEVGIPVELSQPPPDLRIDTTARVMKTPPPQPKATAPRSSTSSAPKAVAFPKSPPEQRAESRDFEGLFDPAESF